MGVVAARADPDPKYKALLAVIAAVVVALVVRRSLHVALNSLLPT